MMRLMRFLLLTCLLLVLGGAAAAEEIPAGLVGQWQMVMRNGEELPLTGTTVRYTFSDETVLVETLDGDVSVEQSTAEYVISGGEIVINGLAIPYTLTGDVLTLGINGSEMALARIQCAHVPDQAEVVGNWSVAEFIGSKGVNGGMSVIVSMGGTVTVSFTDTEMIFRMTFLGETSTESREYAWENGALVLEDYCGSGLLEGDVLTITDGQTGFVLRKIETPAEATAAEQGFIGEWKLQGVSGKGDMADTIKMARFLGAAIEITITDDTVTLKMTVLGEATTVVNTYAAVNDTLQLADGVSVCKLVNGELHVTSGESVMVFIRK